MRPKLPVEPEDFVQNKLKLRDELIIQAYCELIIEHLDNPVKDEATFTQAQLLGRIVNLTGFGLSSYDLVNFNYLRMNNIFQPLGWKVETSLGFYYQVDSSSTITFKPDTNPIQ